MKDSILITNDSNKKLGKRISELIKFSEELKFLIGFFYFSGGIAIGGRSPRSIFPEPGWSDTWDSMGKVERIETIQW